MKKRDNTPSFDFDEPPTDRPADSHDDSSGVEYQSEVATSVGGPVSGWQEVPQARFLSWSSEQQMAYCRDRDLDSLEHADTEWDKEFYLGRANAYDMSRLHHE